MKKNKNELDKKPDEKPIEIPGSPKPDTLPPGGKNELAPVFSFRQLTFEGQFTVDNREWVRYFCDCDNPFFFDATSGEFDDYFRTYKDMYEQAIIDKKECLCDECNPRWEEIDRIPITRVSIEKSKTGDGIEEKEENTEFPVYLLYDIVENLKFSIHSPEDHNKDGKK